MKQNINLYHPIFRKQEKKFSALTMAQAAGLVVAAVVLIYAYTWSQVGSLEAQLKELDRQRESAVKRLTEVSTRFGGQVKANPVDEQIARLEQEIAARQQLQKIAQQGNLGNTEGYSGILVALARQHVEGTWLTRIAVAGRGESMRLEGRSLSPDMVPQYIQRLSREPLLTGTQFKLFQMSRPEADAKALANKKAAPHYVEFYFGTAKQDGVAPEVVR